MEIEEKAAFAVLFGDDSAQVPLREQHAEDVEQVKRVDALLARQSNVEELLRNPAEDEASWC